MSMLTSIYPLMIGYRYSANSVLSRINSRPRFMLKLQSDCILISGFLVDLMNIFVLTMSADILPCQSKLRFVILYCELTMK